MDPKEEIAALTQELEQANYQYYVLDQPSMEDFEYDRKLRRLEELEQRQARSQDCKLQDPLKRLLLDALDGQLQNAVQPQGEDIPEHIRLLRRQQQGQGAADGVMRRRPEKAAL